MNYRCEATTLRGTRCKKNHIVNTPFCIIHNSVPKKKIDCGICLENTFKSVKLENCAHSFCKKCIYKWLYEHDSCPICRASVNISERATAREYCIHAGVVVPVQIKFLHFDEELRITEQTKLVLQGLLCTQFDGYEFSEEQYSLFLNYVTELYKHYPVRYAGIVNALNSVNFTIGEIHVPISKAHHKMVSFKYLI